MATCKWCDRSGLFLRVNEHGLCKSCHPIVAMEIFQRGRIIIESGKIVTESKKLDTRLSRCDLVIEHAEALRRYEQRGVGLLGEIEPSSLVETFRNMRERIILETLTDEAQEATAKAELAKTLSARVNVLSKALLRVREYLGKIKAPHLLAPLEKRLQDLIHRAQLRDYLEAARKAEFKGDKKKALDRYYEALYFLRHDDIDDAQQNEYIVALEKKIVSLGGAVAR